MTLYESIPRLVTRSPVLAFVVFVFGGICFLVSVAALSVTPASKRKKAHRQSRPNTIFIFHANPEDVATGAPLPPSMLAPREAAYRVTFADSPLKRARRGPPAMITLLPSEYGGSLTITTSAGTPAATVTKIMPPSPPPTEAPEPETVVEEVVNSDEQETSPEIIMPSLPSSPVAKKAVLGIKMPKVFRRKPRRSDTFEEGSSSRPSTPRNLSPVPSPKQSPQPKPIELQSEDSRDTVTLSRNNSSRKIEEGGEFLRQRFVNPLRFRPKRSQTTTAIGPRCDTLDSVASTPCTRPPPSSFGHKRSRSLASVVGSVIRVHQTPSRPNSPNRESISSCSSAASTSAPSSSASSVTSCRRRRASSVSERDVPRTQPYGAPYFATPPMPRVRTRRASVSNSGVVVRTTCTVNEEGPCDGDSATGAHAHKHARLLSGHTIPNSELVAEETAAVAVLSSAVEVDGEPDSLGLPLRGLPRRRHREAPLRAEITAGASC